MLVSVSSFSYTLRLEKLAKLPLYWNLERLVFLGSRSMTTTDLRALRSLWTFFVLYKSLYCAPVPF